MRFPLLCHVGIIRELQCVKPTLYLREILLRLDPREK